MNNTVRCGLSITTWLIHTFFVLVDPHPFYCIKMVWIDQNKKGCGSTKTSLTVLAVCLSINCIFYAFQLQLFLAYILVAFPSFEGRF